MERVMDDLHQVTTALIDVSRPHRVSFSPGRTGGTYAEVFSGWLHARFFQATPDCTWVLTKATLNRDQMTLPALLESIGGSNEQPS